MQSIKLVKYVLVIVLTSNFLLHGMSGDRGGAYFGTPGGRYTHELPPITAQNQRALDAVTAQALQEFAERMQKQEVQEKENEEYLERFAKRRRIEKEEDIGEQPQTGQAQALPSTTTATTTTSICSRQESLPEVSREEFEPDWRDLRRVRTPMLPRGVSAPVWEEAEWQDIRRAIDQMSSSSTSSSYTQPLESASEGPLFRDEPVWGKFSTTAGGEAVDPERQLFIDKRNSLLCELDPVLQSGASNLVRTIVERFFIRRICLDELVQPVGQQDYLVDRLTVLAEPGQRITSEHIRRIGQRFPHIRELVVANVGLDDKRLSVLSQELFAANLTELNIAFNKITAKGVQANIAKFTNLRDLNIAHNLLEDAGLAALAQAPFAANLTELNVTGTWITDEGVQANIAAFTSLISLDITANDKVGDVGLAELAQAPFAANLTGLSIGDRITNEGLQANIAAFTSLINLNIGHNEKIDDAGFEAIARAPFARNLIELNIEETEITDAGIAANIQAFTSLAYLDISGDSWITDEGAAVIAQQPFASQLTLKVKGANITNNWLIQHQDEFEFLWWF